MNLRPFYVVSTLVIAGQLLVGLWGVLQVPPGTEVPIHWGVSGEADGYASPIVAFLMLPLMTLGLVALLAVVPRVEPRRENIERSARAYLTTSIALVLIMGGLQLAVVAAGLGVGISMGSLVGVGIGALFVAIGNVMGTIRSNFMFGVRTPWTLTSERSWNRTHRLVGWLFVLLRIVLIGTGLLGMPQLVFGVTIGGVIVVLVVSFVYSYLVWKADPDRQTTAGGERSA